MKFSIIIPNFNYAQYVGAAIESALASDWSDKEVIVVDDASTDGSLEVIDRYLPRIQVLRLPENVGQREACNRGFEKSSGDVVLFLDSDDLLAGDTLQRIAAVWSSDVSKVQMQMERIGPSGTSLGSVSPRFKSVPTPRDVRRWYLRTGAYPSPPGSGNAYARSFLDVMLPLGIDAGDAADSALIAAAPLLGDVVTIAEPLVRYRIHQSNDSNLVGRPERFAREVDRALERHRYAYRVARPGSVIGADLLRRSRELLQLRVAAEALSPGGSPMPGESRRRLLQDALRSPLHPGPEGALHRLAVLGWSLAVLVLPPRAADLLVGRRYSRR